MSTHLPAFEPSTLPSFLLSRQSYHAASQGQLSLSSSPWIPFHSRSSLYQVSAFSYNIICSLSAPLFSLAYKCVITSPILKKNLRHLISHCPPATAHFFILLYRKKVFFRVGSPLGFHSVPFHCLFNPLYSGFPPTTPLRHLSGSPVTLRWANPVVT